MAFIFLTPRFVANTANVKSVSFRPAGDHTYAGHVHTATHAIRLSAPVTTAEKNFAAGQATLFTHPRRVVGIEMVCMCPATKRQRLVVHMTDSSRITLDEDLSEANARAALSHLVEHLDRAVRAH